MIAVGKLRANKRLPADPLSQNIPRHMVTMNLFKRKSLREKLVGEEKCSEILKKEILVTQKMNLSAFHN